MVCVGGVKGSDCCWCCCDGGGGGGGAVAGMEGG